MTLSWVISRNSRSITSKRIVLSHFFHELFRNSWKVGVWSMLKNRFDSRSKIAVNTGLRRDRCLNICSPITLKLLLIEVFAVFERTIEQMFSHESLTAFAQLWSISVFSIRFKRTKKKKKRKKVLLFFFFLIETLYIYFL